MDEQHDGPESPALDPLQGDPETPRSEDLLTPEDPETWKRVVFGIGSRKVWPEHPEPAEAEEDELTRAAVEDPAAAHREHPGQPSTVWPVIFLVVIAVVALGIVFWKP